MGSLGMPVIFASVDRAYAAYESGAIAGTLLIFAVALVLAGAVVGAVHGLALVKLAAPPAERDGPVGAA